MAGTVDAIETFRTIEGDKQNLGVRERDAREGGGRGRGLKHLVGVVGSWRRSYIYKMISIKGRWTKQESMSMRKESQKGNRCVVGACSGALCYDALSRGPFTMAWQSERYDFLKYNIHSDLSELMWIQISTLCQQSLGKTELIQLRT